MTFLDLVTEISQTTRVKKSFMKSLPMTASHLRRVRRSQRPLPHVYHG